MAKKPGKKPVKKAAQKPPSSDVNAPLRDSKKFDALLLEGISLIDAGHPLEALERLKRAQQIKPRVVALEGNLGVACEALGHWEEALGHYQKVLEWAPDRFEALHNRARLFQKLGRFEESLDAYTQAIERVSENGDMQLERAHVLANLGRFEESLAAYQPLLHSGELWLQAYANQGIVLQALGRFEEAEASFLRVLKTAPDHKDARWNFAMLKLAQGRFEEGWTDYEWRWGDLIAQANPLDLPKPLWRGHLPIAGKRLLLVHEQGFGDVLQFSRYALRVEALGAEVSLLVPRPLEKLLQSLSPTISVYVPQDAPPAFDFYCPLMTLPLALGAFSPPDLGKFPYLFPDAEKVTSWAARMACRRGLRVGLAWAGSPRPGDWESTAIDRRRSLFLAQLEKLLGVGGITFYSLQKDVEGGQRVAELQASRWRDQIIDWTDQLKSFSDTAALIANLDLVISVDTAIVHLSGALGKPVWMLDRFDHCWRWPRSGDSSPWYPSLRIFRQSQLGEWETVIDAATDALTAYVHAYQTQYAGAVAESRKDRALHLIGEGRYAEGWMAYEARWETSLSRSTRLDIAMPHWLGESSLAGKRFFIYPEQGLGDMIQFCRYALLASDAGAEVILGVPKPLARLMETLPGNVSIATDGEPLPSFDSYSYLLSLPAAFGTTLESVPARVPYLFADPRDVTAWSARLGTSSRPRVGLVWSGSPKHSADAERSIPLSAITPLLEIEGLDFVSLQKDTEGGAAVSELRASCWRDRVIDVSDEIQDFADTAALIECLDLVISVDTSVVHLAGALGKPVWMLDRFKHCWHWINGRDTSPWYPTLQIFRQFERGDWEPVLRAVRFALMARFSLPGAFVSGGSEPEVQDALRQALVVHQKGDIQGALIRYQHLQSRFPENPEVLQLLGTTYAQLKQDGAARLTLEAAIRIAPVRGAVYNTLGNVCQRLDDPEAALLAYGLARVVAPDLAEAEFNRGNTLQKLGRYAEALLSYDRAITLQPGFEAALNNRANLLRDRGRLPEALAGFNELLELNPDSLGGYLNRAGLLGEMNQPQAALADLDQALTLSPDFMEARVNRATLLKDMGRLEEALRIYDAVLETFPDHAAVRWNRAFLNLRLGRYIEGWEEYEQGVVCGERPLSLPEDYPVWSGETPLAGKRLLMCGEQGLGDVIQFSRYALMAEAMGATVFIGVPKPLARLLRTLPGRIQVVTDNEPLPAADFCVSLMSLPRIFRTTVDTVPGPVPYLFADAEDVAFWAKRMGLERKTRVGLVWAGNPRHEQPGACALDRKRSISVSLLSPLLELDGMEFFSLQKDASSGEITQAFSLSPEKSRMKDWSDDFHDLADTAALIANLDLVITVDTSVAHLAGAMGRPVWMLDRFDHCWRWLEGREDSPWYPTLRIFRQSRMGSWAEPIAEITRALKRFKPLAAPAPVFSREKEIQTRLSDALAAHKAGHIATAIEGYKAILADDPHHFDACQLLGTAHLQSGRFLDAEHYLQAALALNSSDAKVHNNLGVAYQRQGRFADAHACFDRAITLNRGYGDAFLNQGNTFKDEGRLDAAFLAYGEALAINPSNPQALSNRGNILLSRGRVSEALSCYDEALHVAPWFAEAANNKGNALSSQNRLSEARVCHDQALRLRPDYPEARLAKSLIDLAEGCFSEGWDGYESRWAAGALSQPSITRGALWQGEVPLQGKTLYIHPEQGFGDVIQFSRYALLCEAAGARVLLGAPLALESLLKTLPGKIDVFADPQTLPLFDLYISMMSLPRAFRTTLETIPAQVPYLSAEPECIDRWRQRMGPHTRPRVGLVWSGNARRDQPSARAIDQQRSLSLAVLAPILAIPGIDFYSLQKSDEYPEVVAQLREGPWRNQIVDWTDDLLGFADTAALIQNLDLVISVDTAVVHLAGALGKPVWMLDRLNNCWRWLKGRTDSPWYPSLRIFRQKDLGDWGPVIQSVAEALRAYADQRKADVPALTVSPEEVGARIKQAFEQHQAGDVLGAVAAYKAILKLVPSNFNALQLLGVAYQTLGDYEQSVRYLEAAIQVNPRFELAYNNLGLARQCQGKFPEAIAAFETAIRLKPDYLDAQVGRAKALQGTHAYEAAREDLQGVLRRNPAHSDASLTLALLNLTLGHFEAAWTDYERRLEGRQSGPDVLAHRQVPRWTGDTSLSGKTLYIHPEQGLGDVIQFGRYALLAEAQGARVIMAVQPSLLRIMRSLPGSIRIVSDSPDPPPCDLHCSVMSLPGAFRTRLDTIPQAIPYLFAEADLSQAWRVRIGMGRGLRVGLVWAGNPDYPSDRERSLSLETLEPLLGVRGVTFYSLQKGSALGDKREGLIDWTDDLQDFADTAALVANLDLVISVDTSVVHLAAAMGKPVWMLDRFNHTWRWLAYREDCPWYPSLRIFRQQAWGDWSVPVARAAEALRSMVDTESVRV